MNIYKIRFSLKDIKNTNTKQINKNPKIPVSDNNCIYNYEDGLHSYSN